MHETKKHNIQQKELLTAKYTSQVQVMWSSRTGETNSTVWGYRDMW